MSKIIFITGATSGFGAACAKKFASQGHHLILNGRRKDRLKALQQELETKFKINVLLLPFDVRKKEETFSTIENIPVAWREIDILVNNAGLALGRDYFDEALLEDWETMIDTNLKGLLYVTKATLPFLKKEHAHIINIGSTAAKDIYEKGNVYCATKAAVDSISQAMRIDLLRHNIKVTAIHPGAAVTEFSEVRFKGDKETAKNIYNGIIPLTAEDIADTVFYCSNLPAHVCINDLTITCTRQASNVYFNRK